MLEVNPVHQSGIKLLEPANSLSDLALGLFY